MDAFLTGALAGYGIAIPVGAIAILIVQVGIKCGFKCAFFAGAGAATADLVYAALAVVGGAALATAIESAGDSLRLLSAVVLVVIAIIGLMRARSEIEETEIVLPSRTEYAATYARFLGLTIINPTTVVYFAAVIVGLGVAEDLEPGSGAVFAIGAFLASLSWQTLLAGFGGFAGHRISPRAQNVAVIVGNLLILALAVFIVVG